MTFFCLVTDSLLQLWRLSHCTEFFMEVQSITATCMKSHCAACFLYFHNCYTLSFL